MGQGQGLIYSFEADSIYEDGSMVQLLKDVGTSFLRWPGGTVTTYYHWDDLTGQGWMDTWNPAYDRVNDKDPKEYMDLDEYIALCRATGAEAMLGINMSSGMEWGREADALNEAVALVKYCMSQNFDVNYIYLDNETYHNGNSYNKDYGDDGGAWTADIYAEKIQVYADSICTYNPDVKLIANWSNKIQSGNAALKTLISKAGPFIDYVDIHWYWKFNEASWDLWIAKSPMEFENQWYDGSTLDEEIAAFNTLCKELGQPHVKLASLEWNIGPGPWKEDPDHTKFKTALMQSEMQLQMMKGGLELASIWAIHWPGTDDASDRFLVDPDEGHTPNPTAKVFELTKLALEGTVIESNTNQETVQSLLIQMEDGSLVFYLLNRSDVDQFSTIYVNNSEKISVSEAVSFVDPGELDEMSVSNFGAGFSMNLPSYSLSRITLDLSQGNISRNSNQFNKNLRVWPNPCDDKVYIALNSEENPNLYFYGADGRSVFFESYDFAGEKTLCIPTYGLPTGAYYLVLDGGPDDKRYAKLMIL
jgi:hypothetical protein